MGCGCTLRILRPFPKHPKIWPWLIRASVESIVLVASPGEDIREPLWERRSNIFRGLVTTAKEERHDSAIKALVRSLCRSYGCCQRRYSTRRTNPTAKTASFTGCDARS